MPLRPSTGQRRSHGRLVLMGVTIQASVRYVRQLALETRIGRRQCEHGLHGRLRHRTPARQRRRQCGRHPSGCNDDGRSQVSRAQRGIGFAAGTRRIDRAADAAAHYGDCWSGSCEPCARTSVRPVARTTCSCGPTAQRRCEQTSARESSAPPPGGGAAAGAAPGSASCVVAASAASSTEARPWSLLRRLGLTGLHRGVALRSRRRRRLSAACPPAARSPFPGREPSSQAAHNGGNLEPEA